MAEIIRDINERWTEVEHLPQWDEEYYHVYTAKKLGKWVMLKTLRPEYADKPDFQAMLDKEFDVRYNLAHPNIVMINDLEDIPTLGRCIITDDVYGQSLRQLIDEGKITQHHIDQLKVQLVGAMQYIQTNHIVHYPIRPETIIFTDKIENLKLIDVGFDQRKKLTPTDVSDDIYNYGLVVREALDKSGIKDPALRQIANKCLDPDPAKRFPNIEALRMAIEGRSSRWLMVAITISLMVMAVMLAILILIK